MHIDSNERTQERKRKKYRRFWPDSQISDNMAFSVTHMNFKTIWIGTIFEKGQKYELHGEEKVNALWQQDVTKDSCSKHGCIVNGSATEKKQWAHMPE